MQALALGADNQVWPFRVGPLPMRDDHLGIYLHDLLLTEFYSDYSASLPLIRIVFRHLADNSKPILRYWEKGRDWVSLWITRDSDFFATHLLPYCPDPDSWTYSNGTLTCPRPTSTAFQLTGNTLKVSCYQTPFNLANAWQRSLVLEMLDLFAEIPAFRQLEAAIKT